MKYTVLILMVVVVMMIWVTSAFAEGKRSFTGLYAGVGISETDGQFKISHHSPKFSFGKLLGMQMNGDLTTYELGYRSLVAQSNLRLGINVAVHEGLLGGAKQWYDHKSTATFAVASDLRVSAGAELGLVLGVKNRLYVYAGAGVVATNLSLGLSVNTPFGDWSDTKEGGALGALYTVGVQYQATDQLVVGLKASQMAFDAHKALDLGFMGSQSFVAELKQTTVGLTISYNF